MTNFFNLENQLAVVTGGGGKLGIQHARALLLLGCIVELWDVDEVSLRSASARLSEEFSDGVVSSRLVDVTNEGSVTNAAHFFQEKDMFASILINNAALNPKFGLGEENGTHQLEDYPIGLWEKEIAVGLTGSMLCSRILGSQMANKGGGVILNIASDLSVIAPDQRIYADPSLHDVHDYKKPVTYSVIKTGLIGLTRYLATYWADKGVRVNSLSPGGVFEGQKHSFVAKLTNLIPMGRMAEEDEYVGAVQFMCSDASRYMTGQNIVIDGGRSVW